MTAAAIGAPEPRRLSLAAQYVAFLLEYVPVSALRHPGSRVFRAALAEGARRSGVPLTPSRREVARAMLELEHSGQLASILFAKSGTPEFYRAATEWDDWDDAADLDAEDAG